MPAYLTPDEIASVRHVSRKDVLYFLEGSTEYEARSVAACAAAFRICSALSDSQDPLLTQAAHIMYAGATRDRDDTERAHDALWQAIAHRPDGAVAEYRDGRILAREWGLQFEQDAPHDGAALDRAVRAIRRAVVAGQAAAQ